MSKNTSNIAGDVAAHDGTAPVHHEDAKAQTGSRYFCRACGTVTYSEDYIVYCRKCGRRLS